MNHISVLKKEIVDEFSYLSEREGYFLDGTLGAAGHSLAILKTIKNPKIKVIGIDQDENALALAKKGIDEAGFKDQFTLFHTNFKDIDKIISELKINQISGALLDLGVSSMQLDEKERGFSFQNPDELLDMRMNLQEALTAGEILNRYPESAIAQVLREYGEEKFAHQIARNVTEARKKKPIRTVGEFLQILENSIPRKIQATSRHHFATKSFQALRIEVNGELRGLDKAIYDIADLLETGGKLAVITFHSLEDRIVKNALRELENPCHCPSHMPCICGKEPSVRILTKKPIIPSDAETQDNPRSRSAKLRVIEKLVFSI